MRSAFAIVILLVVSSAAAAQAATKLSDLGWMSGCWERSDDKRGMLISEMWMKPSGNAMMGVGRTIKSGKLVDFEFLRIVEDADGLAYISRPSANKEDTTFKMLRASVDEIVFENPAHDFPQRIMYKRNGAKMTARIEGTSKGTLKGIDFRYVRVQCD
ncbi:MAG: hypothetical protein DMF63_11220 [Acidobacteria bacterium]|nr:MAG: hypothetical protein DMF63_11220 [Acidobacteriota bacterium]